MARATTLWIVLNCNLEPIAGFTVRRELRGWLDRQPAGRAVGVVRIPDGGADTPPVWLNPNTLDPAL